MKHEQGSHEAKRTVLFPCAIRHASYGEAILHFSCTVRCDSFADEIVGKGGVKRGIECSIMYLKDGDDMTQADRETLDKMKEEYIRGGVSYRRLSEIYEFSLNKIEKYANKEGWTELRRQSERKAAEKLSDFAADTIVRKRKKVAAAVDRLFDKIMIAIEDTAPEDIQRQKTLADILQKLQTINEFKTPQDLAEQKARIAALKKATSGDGGKEVAITVVSGAELGK